MISSFTQSTKEDPIQAACDLFFQQGRLVLHVCGRPLSVLILKEEEKNCQLILGTNNFVVTKTFRERFLRYAFPCAQEHGLVFYSLKGKMFHADNKFLDIFREIVQKELPSVEIREEFEYGLVDKKTDVNFMTANPLVLYFDEIELEDGTSHMSSVLQNFSLEVQSISYTNPKKVDMA
jgi:hypothetical protein